MTEKSSETWWTDLRWWIALQIVGRAMWIAPPGTARSRWRAYQDAWIAECDAAWKARYQNRDAASSTDL